MANPSAASLSQHFSKLLGRQVTFVSTMRQGDGKTKQVFGIYKCSPKEKWTVVQADFPVLGAFAGALIGLPDDEVRSRLASKEMDEVIKDAISEVLNVASAAVTTEGRTVFVAMVTEVAAADAEVQAFISNPAQKLVFDVTIKDYQCGKFKLLL